MALTFAGNAARSRWGESVAVAAILTRVIVALVLAVLAVMLVAGLAGGHPHTENVSKDLFANGWYGILQSAGLLFLRVRRVRANRDHGRGIKNPERAIPRAITVDLRGAIGFSSFGVLLYYLVANLSACIRTTGRPVRGRRRRP